VSNDRVGYATCMERFLPIFQIFPNRFSYRCNILRKRHSFAWLSIYNDRHTTSLALNFQIVYRLRFALEIGDNDSLSPACLWRDHDKGAEPSLFLGENFHREIFSCCQLLQIYSPPKRDCVTHFCTLFAIHQI